MEDKKRVKTILMITLCLIVCIMSVAYARLATDLFIRGRSTASAVWDVRITDIQEKEKVGSAVSKSAPTHTYTTATFSAGLYQPGDSISYDVNVKNNGTLNAEVTDIEVFTSNNDLIVYKVTGINVGDRLNVGASATLNVKVTFDPNVTVLPNADTNKDITVVLHYVHVR